MSPLRKGIIAGGIVFLVFIIIMVIASMFGPLLSNSANQISYGTSQNISKIGSILQFLEMASCPTAIIVALITYFLAKRKK
jgi:hypothetical protein